MSTSIVVEHEIDAVVASATIVTWVETIYAFTIFRCYHSVVRIVNVSKCSIESFFSDLITFYKFEMCVVKAKLYIEVFGESSYISYPSDKF